MEIWKKYSPRRTHNCSDIMNAFNISHLFASPVASIAIKGNQTKSSKKRNRRRPQIATSVQQIINNDCLKEEQVTCVEKTTNKVTSKKKRKRKSKRIANAARELGSSMTANVHHSRTVIVESVPKDKNLDSKTEEFNGLMSSLQSLSQERDSLEKKLNELREENDELVRCNDDLKDELKEMTDEALEQSVEKQRLLSKVELLKKQLLNRPK